MAYERRYPAFKGIEPLIANVLRILERDMPDELALIAAETSSSALPEPAELLIAPKANPGFPCITVQPDEDDVSEDENRVDLNEDYLLDITVMLQQGDDLEQLTLDIIRYKKAVRNVLLSAAETDMFQGLTKGYGWWEVRSGRYRPGTVNNIPVYAITGMKLHAFSGEDYGGE
jgi:hypothetical protein